MRIAKALTSGEVAVLSLLSEGETHGYALNETLEYRGFRNWTTISFSSIYAILSRLEKQQLIKSRLDQSKKGPARKLYRLTRKGRTILKKTIKIYISEPERPKSRVDLGAAYITLLSSEEAIASLELYIAKIRQRLTQLKQIREAQRPLPFGAEIIFDHGVIKAEAEIGWINGVLGQLRSRQET